MKHISLKIFILVLIAGVLGIAGVIILNNDVGLLSDGYRTIIDEHSENLNCSSEIRSLLYKHQTVVSKHVMASTEDKYDEYEAEAEALETELRRVFDEFGERMSGGEREQIFHVAYTSFYSYLENAENALEFSREGNKGTANYYVVNIMDVRVNKVNESFENLDNYTKEQISEARSEMDGYITTSRISSIIFIPIIIAVVIIVLVFCVKITSDLDRYKTKLEIDIEKKNADLRERNEKMLRIQNNTVIGLANLIESRDGDTGEHVKRTSLYVNMLAKAARDRGYYRDILTDEYIDLLTKAAPLHDIGKIAISDTILNKPGRLTPQEFDTMKNHARLGGQMVREAIGGIEADDYIQIASDVATYHHEKWDGSGYCDGLSGNSIPLCARIMAIADVFDALITKRCYKEAMPVDEAFDIIDKSAGSHFDPDLARIFLEIRDEIQAVVFENR